MDYFAIATVALSVGILIGYRIGNRHRKRDQEEIAFADPESWNARKKG